MNEQMTCQKASLPFRWNAKASTRRQITLDGGLLIVAGSGLPTNQAAIQMVLGPASLSMLEDEAMLVADALIQAVKARRAQFCQADNESLNADLPRSSEEGSNCIDFRSFG